MTDIEVECYEELLQEMRLAVDALHLQLEEKRATILRFEIKLQAARLVRNAFADEIEWEWEPEYTCGTCGAEISWIAKERGGRCGQPCV
jgi:hypothetical protein